MPYFGVACPEPQQPFPLPAEQDSVKNRTKAPSVLCDWFTPQICSEHPALSRALDGQQGTDQTSLCFDGAHIPAGGDAQGTKPQRGTHHSRKQPKCPSQVHGVTGSGGSTGRNSGTLPNGAVRTEQHGWFSRKLRGAKGARHATA